MSLGIVAALPARVTFPRSSTIDYVERNVEEVVRKIGFEIPLNLDFRNCEFIDVISLVYLVALLRRRTAQGLVTTIKLPEDKRVRDFLRLWSFPSAVSFATGKSFKTIACENDDRVYFGENKSLSDNVYSAALRKREQGLRQLAEAKFFALQCFRISKSNTNTGIIYDESSRWNSELVKSVLSNHLQGPEGFISSRVVFEAMTNAVRHASASALVSTSMFEQPGRTSPAGSNGNLTVVYWDDGESMIETLRNAVNDNKQIQIDKVPVDPEDIVCYPPNRDSDTHEIRSTKNIPTKDSQDWEFLLATTFPGVTRDVSAKSFAHSEVKTSHPNYDAPGMGLYLLLNTVADVFKGKLIFRTGRLKMSIAQDDTGKGRYKAKFHAYDQNYPEFLGNMLVVRLPLTKQAQTNE